MKTYTVLPGRCIAIDGLASVTIGIVIADKLSGLRAIEPADADALTRRIVTLLNADEAEEEKAAGLAEIGRQA